RDLCDRSGRCNQRRALRCRDPRAGRPGDRRGARPLAAEPDGRGRGAARLTLIGRCLAPGATIGILGGGQLGRRTALAAARLGYRTHVFAEEDDSPAVQVCGAATVAGWDDEAAITRFAAAIDVATFEFENIPAEAVHKVAALKPVMPRPEI